MTTRGHSCWPCGQGRRRGPLEQFRPLSGGERRWEIDVVSAWLLDPIAGILCEEPVVHCLLQRRVQNSHRLGNCCPSKGAVLLVHPRLVEQLCLQVANAGAVQIGEDDLDEGGAQMEPDVAFVRF